MDRSGGKQDSAGVHSQTSRVVVPWNSPSKRIDDEGECYSGAFTARGKRDCDSCGGSGLVYREVNRVRQDTMTCHCVEVG